MKKHFFFGWILEKMLLPSITPVPIMVAKNKYPLQGSNTSGPQSLFPDQIVDLLDEAQLFVHIRKLQGFWKLKHFNIKLQKLERECKNQTLLQIIRVIQLNAGYIKPKSDPSNH
jgi:hypothetical protein